jgi:hypothetical protein
VKGIILAMYVSPPYLIVTRSLLMNVGSLSLSLSPHTRYRRKKKKRRQERMRTQEHARRKEPPSSSAFPPIWLVHVRCWCCSFSLPSL